MPFLKYITDMVSGFFKRPKNVNSLTNAQKRVNTNKNFIGDAINKQNLGNLYGNDNVVKDYISIGQRISQSFDAFDNQFQDYSWRNLHSQRNFGVRTLKFFSGQSGQEKVGLTSNLGQKQTIREGWSYLTAKDAKNQRFQTQAKRIGGRTGIIAAGIGGAWAANALRKDIQNPDELINRLEQPITYGNGYTQQYPSSYRDRLINILNNTTL